MTTQMRRQQAEILAAYCLMEGKRTWEAWQALHPEANCTAADAQRKTKEEVNWWLAEWKREQERATSPAAHGDGQPSRTKRCAGVANRECSEEISIRVRRCESCAAEQKRLLRQVRNRNYYQAHREALNEKRRERRAERSRERKAERQLEEQRREEERQREERDRRMQMILKALWARRMGDRPFPLD